MPPLIDLMRSGKIEPITAMGVNSTLKPANTEEGLGGLNFPLQMATNATIATIATISTSATNATIFYYCNTTK